MPRIRSLLTAMELDVVKRAHDCQGNPAHRLTVGERRLAVREGRGWDYYCLGCARRILDGDAARVARMLLAIGNGEPASAPDQGGSVEG